MAKLADFLVAEGGGITDPAGPTGRRSGVGRGGLELRGVRNWRDQEPRLGPRWGRAPPENHGQQRRATVSRPCWSAAVSERSPRSLGHPDCLSHGGSPGFKSPHLHPQTLQVRASSVECRRRSLHVAAALRPQAQVKVQLEGSQRPDDSALGPQTMTTERSRCLQSQPRRRFAPFEPLWSEAQPTSDGCTVLGGL